MADVRDELRARDECMQKKIDKRRLDLKREYIRILNAAELRTAQGGQREYYDTEEPSWCRCGGE